MFEFPPSAMLAARLLTHSGKKNKMEKKGWVKRKEKNSDDVFRCVVDVSITNTNIVLGM